jgi:hypothetical protein
MSRLKVEVDGVELSLNEDYQEIWESVESGEVGSNELFLIDPTPMNEGPTEIIQNIAHFLAISGEMFGAKLDDSKYIFGDIDCFDMEEWEKAVIVTVEV